MEPVTAEPKAASKRALLLVLAASVAFYVWERAAIAVDTPFHTISYWAHQYLWFRLLILFGFLLLPVWWWWHASAPVPK